MVVECFGHNFFFFLITLELRDWKKVITNYLSSFPLSSEALMHVFTVVKSPKIMQKVNSHLMDPQYVLKYKDAGQY